jgi:hypothetical protein
MGLLAYWRGRYRLRFGFCPNCNSSPPKTSCFVCRGSHDYYPMLTAHDRMLWRARWEAMRRWH